MEWAIVPFLQTRPQFIGMSWIIVDRSIFGDPVSGEGLKNLLRGKKKISHSNLPFICFMLI